MQWTLAELEQVVTKAMADWYVAEGENPNDFNDDGMAGAIAQDLSDWLSRKTQVPA